MSRKNQSPNPMYGTYPYLIYRFRAKLKGGGRIKLQKTLRWLVDFGDRSKLPSIPREQKQPEFRPDLKQPLICITHKHTEEVPRVTPAVFQAIKEKGFKPTTKNKFRFFKKMVEKLKAEGGWKEYEKQMILKY